MLIDPILLNKSINQTSLPLLQVSQPTNCLASGAGSAAGCGSILAAAGAADPNVAAATAAGVDGVLCEQTISYRPSRHHIFSLKIFSLFPVW